jgi:hypothetical protein
MRERRARGTVRRRERGMVEFGRDETLAGQEGGGTA